MTAHGYLSPQWWRLYNAFPCAHGVPLADECDQCLGKHWPSAKSPVNLGKITRIRGDEDVNLGGRGKEAPRSDNYRGRDTEGVTSMPNKRTTFTRDSIGWGGRGFGESHWTAWREETVIGEWRSRGSGWVFRDDGTRDVRSWRFNDWKRACRDA